MERIKIHYSIWIAIGWVILLCCNCSQSTKQIDYFDVITVDEYDNLYDLKGRLETVKIKTTQRMYKSGVPVAENVDTRLLEYTYRNEGLYAIRKTGSSLSKQTTTTYYTTDSEEIVTIDANNDTIDYALYRYMDSVKTIPAYTRVICKFTSPPVFDLNIDDNYEEWFYYDEKGHRTKMCRHDFNTKQTSETYFFSNTDYKDALRLVPESQNEQVVVCEVQSCVNDTLIEKRFVDGKIDQTVKKYKRDKKRIEYTWSSYGESTETKYTVGDTDIEVMSFSSDYMTVDSTYSKNGKMLRSVHISDDSRKETAYEYDPKGNLTQEICKIKFFEVPGDTPIRVNRR